MQSTEIIHASTVAIAGSAVVILGRSGGGKSALALQLMAFGADLVADDQTVLRRENKLLLASAPSTIKGLVEARGVGILTANACDATPVTLVVDLDQPEPDRLPQYHCHQLLGVVLPCLFRIDLPHFPAAVLQFLKSGRKAPLM